MSLNTPHPTPANREHGLTHSDASLLVSHLQAAYNLARWLLRNETEAEDAVQEAYLRAVRRFDTFRGGDGRSWLLMIVRNCCYDHLHRNAIFGAHLALDEDIQISHSGPDPEVSLLRHEQSHQMAEALQNLPPFLREVLVLRELEEMSYGQIAAVIGVPVGTVMSRLSRARRHLQQRIGSAVAASA